MEITVIEFEGGIDEFPQLIQAIDNLVADGTRRLALDLHALPFINSAALGYLIKAAKTLESLGGEFALARIQPAIARILSMTNLESIFPAFDTVEEAVAYLGGDPEAPAESTTSKVRRTTVPGG
jgi:anti-sigma B factor antagonist